MMQHKVVAYIFSRTRPRRLLVFTHRGNPEAGTQVPAGTVEPGETIEAALWREIAEETGLDRTDLILVRRLAREFDRCVVQCLQVFELTAARELPDSWRWKVAGHGEDEGMFFDLTWQAVSPGLRLAGEQQRWLRLTTEQAH
jgi:8-oxo-dGTP pyrophosphatase MutT (NUDIX family)